MKYQYKIIGLVGDMYDQVLFYKLELDQAYPFNVGDEIIFPETWKEDLGGGKAWKIKKIQHYIVDDFIAIYVTSD